MRWTDRVRLERAVLAYDFWLEVNDVSRRRRVDLRRELRANLVESAAARGAGEAVRALGSTRAMAAEVAETPERARPRWVSGISAGAVAAALSLTVFVFSALAWLDGVFQVAPSTPVTGSLTFWPGSSLVYRPDGGGFSLSLSAGWLPWVIAAAVLLLTARSWRLLRRADAHR